MRARCGRAGGRRYPLYVPFLRSCSHPQTRTETCQCACGRHTGADGSMWDPRGTGRRGDAEWRHSTCPARHDFDDVQRPFHRSIQDQPDARSRIYIENLPLALLEGELDKIVNRDPLLAVRRRLLRRFDDVLGHLAGAFRQTPTLKANAPPGPLKKKQNASFRIGFPKSGLKRRFF